MTPRVLFMQHVSNPECEWKYVVQYTVHYS